MKEGNRVLTKRSHGLHSGWDKVMVVQDFPVGLYIYIQYIYSIYTDFPVEVIHNYIYIYIQLQVV